MSWLEQGRRSLGGRLMLGLSASTIVGLGLLFLVVHVLVRQELYGRFDESLEGRMRALAAYVAGHPGSEEIAEFLPEFRTRAHEDFFQIWDESGAVLVRSDSSLGRDLPRLPALERAPTFHDLALPDGHRGRAVSQGFATDAGDPRGRLTVVMAEETAPLEQLERRLHVILALGIVGAAIVSALTARFAVNRSLGSVRRWSDAVARIDPDAPARGALPQDLPSEMQPVAEKLDALLHGLFAALARERRLTRNIAHELRTPVAEARMIADVGAMSDQLEEARAALREIAEVTAEQDEVIGSMLSLTRYESGIDRPQPEPIELVGELHRQVDALRPVIDRRGVSIDLQAPREWWTHADPTLLRRLLANVIGNAVSHSPAGSRVSISLAGRGELRVTNPAPQLVAEDLERLSERFFRSSAGDANRSGIHAGLGLALSRAMAGLLELRLDLSLSEDRQFVVVVTGLRPLTVPVTAGES